MFDLEEIMKASYSLGQMAATYFKALVCQGISVDIALELTTRYVGTCLGVPNKSPKTEDDAE